MTVATKGPLRAVHAWTRPRLGRLLTRLGRRSYLRIVNAEIFQKPLIKEYTLNHIETPYMGGCQNYGPLLGPDYNAAPNL